MIGECTIKLNNKEIGVLFGVRIFKIIEDEKLSMSTDESDHMNSVNTVWAGIKNHADLLGDDCDATIKDVYQLMNNDFKEFEKALKCFGESKSMGKSIKELSEEVKKKKKKKNWIHRLFGSPFLKTV